MLCDTVVVTFLLLGIGWSSVFCISMYMCLFFLHVYMLALPVFLYILFCLMLAAASSYVTDGFGLATTAVNAVIARRILFVDIYGL